MKTESCKWRISIFLFASLILTAGTLAQNTNGITGRVVDENNEAITGAKVIVKAADQTATRTVVTDGSGEFTLRDWVAGTFILEVSSVGFATQEVKVEGSAPIIITLKPARLAEVISITSNYLAGSTDALDRTAGSLQTIDKAELERARVFDFSEALRRVPGVTARDEEGFGLRPNIGIRGTNPTRSTKVLLLEDGIPLAYAPYGDNASYYHPPVERFESIEVQKGSGQIEYGPVTVAGLVNYITPNPPETMSFNLKLIGGNRDFFNGNAQFGGSWQKTGLILNVNRKQGMGARENNRSGLTDVSSKIVQTLNGRNILTAKFSIFTEGSQITYSGLTEAEFASNRRQNPFMNDRFSGRRIGFSLQHVAILTSRINLTTNFYDNSFSRDWWRQSSNSAQRPNRLNVDPDCRSMADLSTTCGNEGRLRDYRNWAVEPKLNAQIDFGRFRDDIALGFRFTREKQDRIQKNGELPTSRDGSIVEDNNRRNQAISGFFQNRIVVGDFAITAGVRVEQIEFERRNRLNQAVGRTAIVEVIPGIGLTYNVFKNTNVFAGVHRGFAPPRTEDIINNLGGTVEIDAERSWNFEAGIRTRPIEGLNIESTFFRTDYENQIVPASVAGGVGSVVTNGGRTLHQGLEVSGNFRTAFNFYFQTSLTLLSSAEYRGIRFSSVNGFANISVSGNRLPYAPKSTLNAVVGYSYKDLDGFVESNFVGRQFTDDLNTVDPIANGQRGAVQAQTYWNATVNYRVEKLKSVFFVSVKNIFDRTFVVDRSRGILPSGPRLVQTGLKISF